MFKINTIAAIFATALLASGCVNKKLPSAELAKLKGGTTNVVVFAECAPINQLLGSKIAEATYVVHINGKHRTSVSSCSSNRINVASGQHEVSAEHTSGSLFGRKPLYRVFKPGATQYLFIYRDGYSNVFHRWSTAKHAAQIIGAGKGLKKVW